jgi:NAD(P)-dependent dehydrogenase (short-subunit alcohol dehydrogenase family)
VAGSTSIVAAVHGKHAGPAREAAYEEAIRAEPLRRMSEPGDVAGTVRWLLSTDAVESRGRRSTRTTAFRFGEYVVDEERVTGLRGSSDEMHVVAIYHVAGDAIDHVRMIR